MNLLLVVRGGVGELETRATIPALLALVARLARRHHVTIAALSQDTQPREYDLLGARVHCLGASTAPWGLSIAGRFLQIRKFVVRQPRRYDLVHAIWLGQTSTLALMMGRWLNVPVVATIGGGELAALRDIQYGGQLRCAGRLQSRLALRAAHRVTGGSHYVLREVLRRRADAVWIPLFPAVKPSSAASRAGMSTQPRILTASSINRVKDPTTLLRALQIVVEQIPDASLEWAGEDVLGGEAQRLAQSLGIADRVRFHGLVSPENMPALYASSSLYVQASRHESQGVAVCEAAAAGLPIVGTDVGILSELAPSAAIAVPVRDPAALGAAMVSVLRQSERAAELSRHALRWAQQYSADWTAERFESVYGQLTQQRFEFRRVARSPSPQSPLDHRRLETPEGTSSE